MAPNRVVAVLTPLLFAPLAGAICAWLAEHFPGFEVDQGALTEVFIVGALIALAPAAQWLSGWQKHEARQAELRREVALGNASQPGDVSPGSAEPTPAEPGLDELEELDELDELDGLDGLDELDELDGLDGLDELDELGDLDGLDEVAELEELTEMDELDADSLSDDERPAVAGG
jgi:hypothetical protein